MISLVVIEVCQNLCRLMCTCTLHALVDDTVEQAAAVVAERWRAVGVYLEVVPRPRVLHAMIPNTPHISIRPDQFFHTFDLHEKRKQQKQRVTCIKLDWLHPVFHSNFPGFCATVSVFNQNLFKFQIFTFILFILNLLLLELLGFELKN